jgi:hypothetical protein
MPSTHADRHQTQIWGLADTENRGFLQQEDFAKALRLIGHYQAQPGRPLDPDLALSRTFTICIRVECAFGD